MAVLRRRAGGDSPLEVPEWLALGTSFQGGFYEGLGAHTPLQIQGGQGRRGVESFAAGLLERLGPAQWGITGWGATGSEDLGFYQFGDLSPQVQLSSTGRRAQRMGSYGYFPGLASVAWLLPERSLPTEPVIAPRLSWGRFTERTSTQGRVSKGLLSQGEAQRRASQLNAPRPQEAAKPQVQAPRPQAQAAVVTPKAKPIVRLSASDRGFVAPPRIEPELERSFEALSLGDDFGAFPQDDDTLFEGDILPEVDLSAEGELYPELHEDVGAPAFEDAVLSGAPTLEEAALTAAPPQADATPLRRSAPTLTTRRGRQIQRAQAQASLLRAALQGGRPRPQAPLPTVKAGLRGGLRPLSQGTLIQGSSAPSVQEIIPQAQGPQYAQMPPQAATAAKAPLARAAETAAPEALTSAGATNRSAAAPASTATPQAIQAGPKAPPRGEPSREAAPTGQVPPSASPSRAEPTPRQGRVQWQTSAPAQASPAKGVAPLQAQAEGAQLPEGGITPEAQAPLAAASTRVDDITPEVQAASPIAAAPVTDDSLGSAAPLASTADITTPQAAAPSSPLSGAVPSVVPALRRGTRDVQPSSFIARPQGPALGRGPTAAPSMASMGLSATLEVGQGHLLRAAQAAAQLTIAAPDLRQTGFTSIVSDGPTLDTSPQAASRPQAPRGPRGSMPPRPSLGSLLSGESAPIEVSAPERVPYAQVTRTKGLTQARAQAQPALRPQAQPQVPAPVKAQGRSTTAPQAEAPSQGSQPAVAAAAKASQAQPQGSSRTQARPTSAKAPGVTATPATASPIAASTPSMAAPDAPRPAPVVGTRRLDPRPRGPLQAQSPWSSPRGEMTTLDLSGDVRRAVDVTPEPMSTPSVAAFASEALQASPQARRPSRPLPQGHLPSPLVGVGTLAQGVDRAGQVAAPIADTRRRIGPQSDVQSAPLQAGSAPLTAPVSGPVAPRAVQASALSNVQVGPVTAPFQGNTRLGDALGWLSNLGAPELNPIAAPSFEFTPGLMHPEPSAEAPQSALPAAPVRLRSAAPPALDTLVSAEGLTLAEGMDLPEGAPSTGPTYSTIEATPATAQRPSAPDAAPLTASQALAAATPATPVATPVQRPQVALSRRAPGLPQPASSPIARASLPRLTEARPALTSARSQAVIEQVRGQLASAGIQAMPGAAPVAPSPAQAAPSASRPGTQGPTLPDLAWFESAPQVVSPEGQAPRATTGGATFQWADLIGSRLGALTGSAPLAEGLPGSLGESFSPRSFSADTQNEGDTFSVEAPLQRRAEILGQLAPQGVLRGLDLSTDVSADSPELGTSTPVQVRQRAFSPITTGALLSAEGQGLPFEVEESPLSTRAPRGLRAFAQVTEAQAAPVAPPASGPAPIAPADASLTQAASTPEAVAAQTASPTPAAPSAPARDQSPALAAQAESTPALATAPTLTPGTLALPKAAVAPQRRSTSSPSTALPGLMLPQAKRGALPGTTVGSRSRGLGHRARSFGVLPELGDLLPNQLRWLGAEADTTGIEAARPSRGVGASRGRDIRRAASPSSTVQARREGARGPSQAPLERVSIPGRRRPVSPEALVRGLDDLITAEGILAPTTAMAPALGLRQDVVAPTFATISSPSSAPAKEGAAPVQGPLTPEALQGGTSAATLTSAGVAASEASPFRASPEGVAQAPVKVVRRQLESFLGGAGRPMEVLAELRAQGVRIDGLGNAPYDPTLEPEAFLASIEGVDIIDGGSPAIRFRGETNIPGTPRVLRAQGSGEWGHLPLPLTVLTAGELALDNDGGWSPWMGEGELTAEPSFAMVPSSPVEAQKPKVQLRQGTDAAIVPATRHLTSPAPQALQAGQKRGPMGTLAPEASAAPLKAGQGASRSRGRAPWSQPAKAPTASGIEGFETTLQALPQGKAPSARPGPKGSFDWSGLIPANLSWLVGPSFDETLGDPTLNFSAPVAGEDVALAQPIFGQARRPVVPSDQPLLRAESSQVEGDLGEDILRVTPLAQPLMDTALVPQPLAPRAAVPAGQQGPAQSRWHLSEQVTARFTEVATRLAAVSSAQSSGPLGAIAQAAQRFLAGQGQSYGGVEAAAMDLVAAGRSVTNTYGMTGSLAAPIAQRAPASGGVAAAPLVAGGFSPSMSTSSFGGGVSSRTIARPSLNFLFQRGDISAQSLPSTFSTRAQIPRSPKALPAMMKGVGSGFDALSFGGLVQGAQALQSAKRPISTYPGSPEDSSAGIRAGLGQLRLNTAPQARPQRRPAMGQGIHIPDVTLPTGAGKSAEAPSRHPVTTARTSTPWATRRVQGAREALPSYQPTQILSRPSSTEETRIAPSGARGLSSERMTDFSMSAPLSRALLQAESRPQPAQAYFKERGAETPGGAQAPMEENQGGQQERPVGLEEVIEEVRWRLQLESRWESELD